MADNARRTTGEVIESERWLRERIESLLESREPLRALDYVTKLLSATSATETKLYCYRRLGMLTFRSGNLRRAREAFHDARELSPQDPGLAYALAHCESASGRWWHALRHSLEAFHFAEDLVDEAEFLRIGAHEMHRLGHSDTALAMLLGALDRAPRNPWILETIGLFYEREQMWMEALGMRDRLVDLLSDGMIPTEGRSPKNVENPQFYRVFRSFAVKFQISPEAIHRRRNEITDRLRSEIALADGARPNVDGASSEAPLTPRTLPRGLSTLVDQLSSRDRNYTLLESAQSLWAKARHDRFDVELTPNTLAAAIQWAVERLHWRIPTPCQQLATIYKVVPETLRAAARLVVGRFEVQFLSLDGVTPDIGPAEWERLDTLQKALLYDVPLEDVRPSAPMLGE